MIAAAAIVTAQIANLVCPPAIKAPAAGHSLEATGPFVLIGLSASTTLETSQLAAFNEKSVYCR
jgi:hypothetical protein